MIRHPADLNRVHLDRRVYALSCIPSEGSMFQSRIGVISLLFTAGLATGHCKCPAVRNLHVRGRSASVRVGSPQHDDGSFRKLVFCRWLWLYQRAGPQQFGIQDRPERFHHTLRRQFHDRLFRRRRSGDGSGPSPRLSLWRPTAPVTYSSSTPESARPARLAGRHHHDGRRRRQCSPGRRRTGD